ncbi:hypothetical protein [Halosimplex pelagicum]|uniref:Transcription factor TFIIB cyclin-like domain-containing protein n=1 Tax=Halosimplex pelagicum TaxID=869886 RepID=A0A7D5T5A8_9EURY|nr:hypothetical protein [Halosimplex pelagicum]QLH82208.1 hypothetical protein HZS54_11580 [Halosimplex pelagicum]
MTENKLADHSDEWQFGSGDPPTLHRSDVDEDIPSYSGEPFDIVIEVRDSSAAVISPKVDRSGWRALHKGLQIELSSRGSRIECAVELIDFFNKHLSKTGPEFIQDHPPSDIIGVLSLVRDLPEELQTQANSLHKQYEKNRDKDIHDHTASAAAAVYLVEQLNGIASSYSDFRYHDSFTDITGISIYPKMVRNRTKDFQKFLPIDVTTLTDPSKEVEKASESLGLTADEKELAMRLAVHHTEYDPQASGYKPGVIAGAAVYNASQYYGSDYTQNDIASTLDISTSALREKYENQWELLSKHLDSFPP